MFRHLALFALVASLGSSSVLAHHSCEPLDTILAACSTNSSYKGMADCLKQGINSVCAHPRQGDLRAIHAACQYLSSYDGETSCLKGGINAVIQGQSYFHYTPTICTKSSTYSGMNGCFKEMIGRSGDSNLQNFKKLCVSNPTQEGEMNCYRKLFHAM